MPESNGMFYGTVSEYLEYRKLEEINLDFHKLIKDIASKTTIEDSVDELIAWISHELMDHPADSVSNLELATRLAVNRKAIGTAIAENIVGL